MLGTGKALIALLGSDAPVALILEDDAGFAPNTPGLLESVDWRPPGAHIVRLEEGSDYPHPLWQPSGRTSLGRALRRLERWCPGAAANLIDRRSRSAGAQLTAAGRALLPEAEAILALHDRVVARSRAAGLRKHW